MAKIMKYLYVAFVPNNPLIYPIRKNQNQLQNNIWKNISHSK